MGQKFANQRLGVNISAGTGLATTGTIVFSNSNGVSFGMSLSAGTYVVTASVATGPTAISAGTTQATLGTVVFSNSNGISFGLNNNTLTAKLPTISFLAGRYPNNYNVFYSTSTVSGFVQRLPIPDNMNASRFDLLGFFSTVGTVTGTQYFALYTMSGSTASLVMSASGTVSASGTAPGLAALAWLDITFNSSAVIPGDYLIYGALSMNQISVAGLALASVAASISQSTIDWFEDGWLTNSSAPASIHMSDVKLNYTMAGTTNPIYPIFRILGS